MKQKIGIQHLLKMIHEISLPFVIRQAKNRRHAYYTMVEMGTNWLNKKIVIKLSY